MLSSIDFHNFKVLKDATLPLGRFTLIVGPNGSGKSTALLALQSVMKSYPSQCNDLLTVGLQDSIPKEKVELLLHWETSPKTMTRITWSPKKTIVNEFSSGDKLDSSEDLLKKKLIDNISAYLLNLSSMEVFNLRADEIAKPVYLQPNDRLDPQGGRLAGVLDRIRDQSPEKFEDLNKELSLWFPEYDRILFDTPAEGHRSFLLRTKDEHYQIPATELSQGTLLALAVMTLAYLPEPPLMICLEEPDRGLHPRLLRYVQDALYRLAYPENYNEQRNPIQVVVTTHSPYFLDLFRDFPEEVVISEKTDGYGTFHRLTEHPHIDKILSFSPLGDVWYSGALGGVPLQP